jgi:signal transduction histidine kinase
MHELARPNRDGTVNPFGSFRELVTAGEPLIKLRYRDRLLHRPDLNRQSGKTGPLPGRLASVMEKSAATPDDQELILSNLSPTPAERRLALGVVLVLLACCVGSLASPLSTQPLGRIDAFMPAYATALFVTDSITAALLFGQFSVLRSPALLALASGYLWSGFTAIPWVLTFPGVLPQASGLGDGIHNTAWLYFFWHEGFILFVIVYVLLKNFDPLKGLSKAGLRGAVLASVGSVAALVLGATVLVTSGLALLPPIITDTGPRNVELYLLGPLYALIIVAIVLLLLRLRSVLDLWLMVVLFAFMIELTLSVYPSLVRFTVGWYVSRVYALLCSTLLLFMLVIETTKLYERLLHAVLAQHREREVRQVAMDTMAAAIAHELKQPLGAIANDGHAGLNFILKPDLDEARVCFESVISSAHRASEVIDGIRSLYKKDIQGRAWLDVNEVVGRVLTLVDADLRTHRVSVSTDLRQRLPQLRANRPQLEEVFLNLIKNAIEAMHSVTNRARLLRISSDVIQGSSTVLVTIEDSGTGIDGKDKERVFEPFFTTKSKGMGIGLAICRAIVESHGGTVQASANNPYGTIFHLALPGGKF